jgi:hypothetical protein
VGLPGEIGHGMRYLTDQARQALGYAPSPEYVAGTGRFSNPLDVGAADVQRRIEQATGPLYEPKTTAGRYAGAIGEIAGGSLVPIGGAEASVARELTPYLKNMLASSVGAGAAGETASEAGAPPWLQAAAGVAGGHFAPGAANEALSMGSIDPRMKAKTQAAWEAQQEGISVPKAAVAGSLAKPVAGRIASLPLVGAPLQNAARTSLDETGARAQAIADAYGAGDRATAGSNLRDALVGYMNTGSREPINRLYDKVDLLVDDTQPHQLLNTSVLAHALRRAQTAAQRATNEAALGPIAEDLENPNGLTYSGIKELRTKIGGMLDDNLLPQAGTTKPVLKRIYGALTKDLRSAVQTNGSDALEAFDRANKLNQVVMTRREELQRIVGKAGTNAGENVFETMIQMAGDTGKSANIERLRLARKAVDPQTWDDFSSAFVRRMGIAPNTDNFSPDRFLTAYGKLSDEGKQLLFNSTGKGDLAASLNRLRHVSEQFSEFYKMGNPSGTGGATFVTSLFGVGSIGGLINPLAAIGSASSALGMFGTAKYFASPANVDKMTNTIIARLNYIRNPNPTTERRLTTAVSALMASPKSPDERSRGGSVRPTQPSRAIAKLPPLKLTRAA